jgi:hypothetical protein
VQEKRENARTHIRSWIRSGICFLTGLNPWKKSFREIQPATGGLFLDFSQRTYHVMGQIGTHKKE